MTGIVLLAAGESARFGSPKQLADFRGQPLLRHAAQTALDADLGPVNVVLGAVEQPCRDALAGMEVKIIHHPGWKEGMAGSLAAGIRPWAGTQLDGLIVMLADQPAVTAPHLRALAAAGPDYVIAASRYGGRLGVPAWFSPGKFPDLLMLTGAKGAQSLIAREARVLGIEAPGAAFDIDTPADLARVPD